MQHAVIALDQHFIDQAHGVILRRIALGHVIAKRERGLGGQRIFLGGMFFFFLARFGKVGLRRQLRRFQTAEIFLHELFGLSGVKIADNRQRGIIRRVVGL